MYNKTIMYGVPNDEPNKKKIVFNPDKVQSVLDVNAIIAAIDKLTEQVKRVADEVKRIGDMVTEEKQQYNTDNTGEWITVTPKPEGEENEVK